MSNLLQAKLLTGEWIIGAVQDKLFEDTESILLKQPRLIQIVPQGPQQYGLALVPFDPTDPEGTLELFLRSIVARPTSIARPLHDAYVKQTSQFEIVSELEAGIAGIKLGKK
jgi:hypothetical protein